MLNELIGKDVEIMVSFAGCLVDAGMAPVAYTGNLVSVDDNFVKLRCYNSNLVFSSRLGINFNKTEGNTIMFRNDYIVYVKEM